MRRKKIVNFYLSKCVKTCFTLIELLVVIGVMSLLMLMLVPTIGKAKDAAKKIQCINNLRQIGMAQFMYSDDHEGRVCPVTPNFWNDSTLWYQENFTNKDLVNGLGFLYPSYLDDLSIYYCPSANPSYKFSMSNFGQPGKIAYADYHYGHYYFENTPMVLDKYAKKILALDYNSNAFMAQTNFSKGCNHPDGLNVLWPDGSVKWYKRNPPAKSQDASTAIQEQITIENSY